MHIRIAERLRPFTHLPGSFIPLPGSTLRLQIFPALIKVEDLAGNEPIHLADIEVNIQGPIREFTVQLDLEKGCVTVWGKTEKDFLRYRIFSGRRKSFSIVVEKAPLGNILILHSKNYKEINKEKTHWFLPNDEEETTFLPFKPLGSERLSLGNHKSQDWEMVQRRLNFIEIFPFWLRLGKLLNGILPDSFPIASPLLDECQQAISASAKGKVLKNFERLYLASFQGILSPGYIDVNYQGIIKGPLLKNGESPFFLLQKGASLIKDIFFKQDNKTLFLLPCLPKEFHAGRFLHLECEGLGMLDMEWSKGELRQIVLTAEHSGTWQFNFQKQLKKFRLRKDNEDKGYLGVIPEQLSFEKGKTYLFDRFEK